MACWWSDLSHTHLLLYRFIVRRLTRIGVSVKLHVLAPLRIWFWLMILFTHQQSHHITSHHITSHLLRRLMRICFTRDPVQLREASPRARQQAEHLMRDVGPRSRCGWIYWLGLTGRLPNQWAAGARGCWPHVRLRMCVCSACEQAQTDVRWRKNTELVWLWVPGGSCRLQNQVRSCGQHGQSFWTVASVCRRKKQFCMRTLAKWTYELCLQVYLKHQRAFLGHFLGEPTWVFLVCLCIGAVHQRRKKNLLRCYRCQFICKSRITA